MKQIRFWAGFGSSAVGIVLISSLWLTACAPKENPADGPSRLREHPALDGSLYKIMKEISDAKSPFKEACDTQSLSLKLEIAATLDKRAPEIEKLASGRSRAESSHYRRVKMGPIMVRELIKPFEASPEWVSFDDKTWTFLFQTYSEIKNSATNAHWVVFNSDVQYLMSNDYERIINGRNYFLDKDSGPKLETLAVEVQQCLDVPSCFQPQFSADSSQFLTANPLLKRYIERVQQASTLDQKRDILKNNLSVRLKNDSRRYAFFLNESIRALDSATLSVPLDPGVLSEVTAQLASYIEPIWSKPGYEVKIDWVKDPEPLKAFKVLVGSEFGGRSYVLYDDRSVNLFSDVRSKSIAHEIGHVLGFRDHYYTTWRSDSCKYVTQARSSDLMSDSDAGGVMEEEWAELKQRYH